MTTQTVKNFINAIESGNYNLLKRILEDRNMDSYIDYNYNLPIHTSVSNLVDSYLKNDTEKVSENSKIINFTASPIDRGLDGIIEIEVYDKNGNGKKLTYNYKGINISQLKYINTGDLYHPDTTCIKYKIKNESDNEIKLISISEPEFNGLKLKHNLTFPFQFKAKDSIEIELCLNTSLKT
jgi:hypothetical protein